MDETPLVTPTDDVVAEPTAEQIAAAEAAEAEEVVADEVDEEEVADVAPDAE